MDLKRPELLGIYLNDHLAGSVVGVELARRARDSNEGTEFGAPLAEICAQIEADRQSLISVIDELGFSRSRIKPAAGWLAEKVGRLKPNGQLRGYSPLSRVVEFEGLLTGITGKLRLWEILGDIVADKSAANFAELARRAEDQRLRVAKLQHRAVQLL